jgi:hypothetical protein
VNAERRSYANPRISPDGTRLIVQAGDLWMQDLARGTFSRLTTGEILTNGFPIWMPDGRVMYRSQDGIRLQGTSGPDDRPEVLRERTILITRAPSPQTTTRWSFCAATETVVFSEGARGGGGGGRGLV